MPHLPEIPALLNQGLQYHQTGQLAEAEGFYRQALARDPANPNANHLLGVLALQGGDAAGAVERIQRAIGGQPDQPHFHNNLGNALRVLGRAEEALAAYQQAARLHPGYPEARYNAGLCLQGLGRLDEAIEAFEQAIALTPDYAEALNNLGICLKDRGDPAGAAARLEAAHALDPHAPGTLMNLGNALAELGRGAEALQRYAQALELAPELPGAWLNYGAALAAQGRLAEALTAHETAFAHDPCVNHAKGLLHCLLYQPGLSNAALFAKHREKMGICAARVAPLPPLPPARAPSAERQRRIRVGYLSSDLRDHPVGRNVAPLILAHDRDRFEVFCYADVIRIDPLAERLRAGVDHWRRLNGLSDAEAARLIRADAIDVLVCLAGHFDENRPLVPAFRPAPVQVSFHDGATSGLEAMDYWLTDGVLHPPLATDESFTETLHRLPVFYNYPPPIDAPPPAPPPSERTGRIAFGSFNHPTKINDAVIDCWAEILARVDGSTLILKYRNVLGETDLGRALAARFAHRGIDPWRIRFFGAANRLNDHLAQYAEIDIALDPFPYSGATTTFEALWMGVPVVALAGERFIGRMAMDILVHAGFPELVAPDRDGYVALADALAGDPGRLRTLRGALRERLAASALCDGPAYARTVESAFGEMWARRAEGETPRSAS